MSDGAKESRLSRWSRLKQEAVTAPPDDLEALAVVSETSLATPVSEEVEQEPAPLTDADMPDLDSLGEDSDFTGFMSPGVSDELRNLALRKLFHAPVFNIRDGLDEYDEDYTSFEKLGDIVTCDMKHQIEVQERKLREAQEQEEQAEAEAQLQNSDEMDDEDDTEVESLNDESLDDQNPDDENPSSQPLAATAGDNSTKADIKDE
jgi:hypothetical protein